MAKRPRVDGAGSRRVTDEEGLGEPLRGGESRGPESTGPLRRRGDEIAAQGLGPLRGDC
jgi:hypothetical protein